MFYSLLRPVKLEYFDKLYLCPEAKNKTNIIKDTVNTFYEKNVGIENSESVTDGIEILPFWFSDFSEFHLVVKYLSLTSKQS